jgi:dTDP-4-dehydrorhamnose 3,5-epimerase
MKEGVRRFYTVSNHSASFVRAWHAHKNESKCVVVLSGAAIVGAVKIDDWASPSKDLPVERFVLTAQQPKMLKIPAGYANGFKTLLADTKLIFFSNKTLEECKDDDYRYEAHYWEPWDIVER